LIAQDILIRYPGPNLPFDIKTNASDYQLGAIIKQANKTLAFYSRELTAAQLKYSTMEKVLLSILEVHEAYRSMLWGAQIRIYTDHQNLIHSNFCSHWVLSWGMLVKDFKPEMFYKPGPLNVEADFISCYSMLPCSSTKSAIMLNQELDICFSKAMLNYPVNIHVFPLDFTNICQAQ
jgi:hypothetical protein